MRDSLNPSSRAHSGRRRHGLVYALGVALSGVLALSATILPAGAAAKVAQPRANTAYNAVPAQDRIYYQNYQLYTPVYTDAYAHWTPPKGKVKICGTTFYLGNTYQQGFKSSLQSLVNDEVKAGLAKPGLIYLNSNEVTATGISQLQSEIEDGCNVIFAGGAQSTTAFCQTLKSAFDKGILVFASVDCNYSISVTFDVYHNSLTMFQALAKALNGKGNILMIQGVPGISDANTATDAGDAVLKQNPGLHLVGQYSGDWTASVAATATAQWLATHSTTVNGIFDDGAMGVAAEQEFQSAGRPLPKLSLQEGDCQELAFEKAHPNLVPFMSDQAPAPQAYADFDVMLRMLAGQKPALGTIIFPIPGPTKATFSQWYKSSMTLNSSCFANPAPALPTLGSYIATFFTGGKPVANIPTPSL